MPSRRSVLAAGLIGAGVAGVWRAAPAPPEPAPVVPSPFEVASPTPASQSAPPPVGVEAGTVMIPALGISQKPVPVGVEDGVLRLPRSASELGWFSGSAGFGQAAGNTLIAGHVSWRGPGVLKDLAGLRAGDWLWLVDDAGARHGFILATLFSVKKTVLPSSVWTGPVGVGRSVTVVTCGGEVIRSSAGNHYDSNTVAVFVPT